MRGLALLVLSAIIIILLLNGASWVAGQSDGKTFLNPILGLETATHFKSSCISMAGVATCTKSPTLCIYVANTFFLIHSTLLCNAQEVFLSYTLLIEWFDQSLCVCVTNYTKFHELELLVWIRIHNHTVLIHLHSYCSFRPLRHSEIILELTRPTDLLLEVDSNIHQPKLLMRL